MLVGEIRNQIDQIWNDFWSGGLSNPLMVMEQITYLLFIRRLDELHTNAESKAKATNKTIERRLFPEGNDPRGLPYEQMRWRHFKSLESQELFRVMDEHIFPFIRSIGDKTAIGEHMKEARFAIPTPQLLMRAVDKLSHIKMDDRDTKGDVYEYLLSKIASSGQNGQFRTPRHIINMMVQLVKPTRDDVICDPAAGTCGFLVSAGEYLRENDKELFYDEGAKAHFHNNAFNGFDFDPTMLRIGSMNMILHGIENPIINAKDALAEESAEEKEKYSLILANPPFAGSLDYESTAKNLQQVVKTKKTELLFLALFLRLLKTGGRAAVIVPDGVLFGSSTAHKAIRQKLVEEQKLEAVISLPSGVFKPYAGVSTAILIFTKTNSGGTDKVWFYDMLADGFSLDDKRQAIRDNDIQDIITKYEVREGCNNPRTAQSFNVTKQEIAESGAYDLSLNRYKHIEHEEVKHESVATLFASLKALEDEIATNMAELEELL